MNNRQRHDRTLARQPSKAARKRAKQTRKRGRRKATRSEMRQKWLAEQAATFDARLTILFVGLPECELPVRRYPRIIEATVDMDRIAAHLAKRSAGAKLESRTRKDGTIVHYDLPLDEIIGEYRRVERK